MKIVLGIDPGLSGALVWLSKNGLTFAPMPLNEEGRICYESIKEVIENSPPDHIYIERAVAFGMGVTGAFNYGQDFNAIKIGVGLTKIPFTLVEPGKWAKVMHQGIDKDMKPKAKSIVAVKRLYPQLLKDIPKGPRSGKFDEGIVDALLIAGYGLKQSEVEYEW